MLHILQKSRAVFVFLTMVLVTLASAPAWALTTGSLRVTVTDDMELSIPGVALTLSGETLIGGKQERVTDANGQHLFTALPPGTYRLSVVKAGFKGVTIDGIQVDVNRTTQQRVVMEVGEIDEEITVVETRAAVDTESSTRGTVLTKEFLNRIPAGRSYQAAVQMAPGVSGGSNPNMAGGASNENTYMLDGANITDPVTGTFSANFNFDAIQQIEVLLGGYMPEYGVSVGGIVNVVTESGTNNLEFNQNVYYINGDLRPRKDARLAADGVELMPTGFDQTTQQLQVGSKVSGPIVRDKAWFIVSYQQARSLFSLAGTPQRQTFSGHYMLAKVTVQPTTEHRLSAFFQTDPTNIDNIVQGTPFVRNEAQGRQAQGGFISQARWQWFLSPDVNLDSQLLMQKSYIEVNAVPCTHDRDQNWHPCRPGEIEGAVDWETPGRIGFGGAYDSVNWGAWTFDDRFRYSASSKLSILSVEDPLGGTHDFKFGVEGSQLVWDSANGYAGNALYYDINEVPFDPQTLVNYYYLEISGPVAFRTTASQFNVFAQDSWKPVSNLTINYGSRFDTFVMRNDVGDPVLTGALFGPRLFGAWDPWGDQKTKIATGYGRFNDTGRLGTAAFTSAGNFGSKLYLGNFFVNDDGLGPLSAPENQFDYDPNRNLATAHDNLRTPRVDEVILTLEREVIKDIALISSMSSKFTRNGYEFDETNLIYDEDGSSVIGSRRGDAFNPYFRQRTPTLAKRDYFQWDLGFRKVLSRRWQAEGTYVYIRSVGSSSISNSGSFAVDPQTQYNYGLLTTSSSQFKAYAFWDLPTDPWTQTVGFFFNWEQGFPYERLYWAESFAGSQFGNYQLRIRPRGTYLRFGDNWYLSLKFQQKIDVRKGNFTLDFELRNITNNRAPTGLYTFPLFANNRIQSFNRQFPLTFQAGVRYEF
jgi:hypothetical protein